MNDVSVLLPIALGLAALAVLVQRGALRPDALDAAPVRAVDLNVLDLMIGFVLVLLGLVALGGVIRALGIPIEEPAKGEPIHAWREPTIALLSQLFSQVPAAVFFIVRVARQPNGPKESGLVSRAVGAEARAGGLALVGAIPLVFGVGSLVVLFSNFIGDKPPEIDHELLRAMSQADSRAAVTVMLGVAVVSAPLLEEIIYRGLLQTVLVNLLGRSHRWVVILLSALFFAGLHYGSVSWHGLPSLFVLGVMLGWLYEKHGSLWPGLLLHAGFNAFNVVLALWVVKAG